MPTPKKTPKAAKRPAAAKRTVPAAPPAARKAAAEPAKEPAGRVTLTIPQLLASAGKLAAEDKLAAAIALLEQAVGKLGRVKDNRPLTLNDLLVETAIRVRVAHPANAARLVQEALDRDPGLVVGWYMLSGLRDRLGDHASAKEAALRVVQSPDARAEHVIGAANLLVRFGEDKIAYEAACRVFEQEGRPLSWASALLYITLRAADWQTSRQLTAQLLAGHKDGKTHEARESPRTHLLWCDDEAINVEVVKDWSLGLGPLEDVAPPVPAPLEGRRIRVGYLSSDFRDHPTSRLVNGLLRNHDRSKFELFMYCSGWDDKSAMRREIVSHFDHVHTVTSMSDDEAAALIRSHGIDVLVELNGPTRANRMGILRYRPAPVQVDYLGWPGSVGGRVVDYVVGDLYTLPAGVEKLYPEKVIRLSSTYQVNDYAALPSLPPRSRKDFRLPEGVPVIGMFNAINKVNGEVWQAWMQVMQAVPDAVLWLLDPGPLARKHIAAACRAAGVDVKRIIIAKPLKQDEHLARLQCCDLMLDPWPYGGHTSTADALFARVPVIALEGRNFAARVNGGLLHAAGLGVLVRPTVEDYVRTAVDLLKSPARRNDVKAFLRDKVPLSDVFNAKSKAAQFEAAYRLALQRVIDGQPARQITFAGKKEALPAVAKVQAAAAPPPVPSTAGLQRIVLVCGPWGGGTSAVAGALARAGIVAPGPYFVTDDPKTPETGEMLAFHELLEQCASHDTLGRLLPSQRIVELLREFRDTTLKAAAQQAGAAPETPLLLKDGLAALLLPEVTQVFDTRIVCVLRPVEEIEATRLRRGWGATFGKEGATRLFSSLFTHAINRETPMRMVRYADLLAKPEEILHDLLRFCGVEGTAAGRAAAIAFLAAPRGEPGP